MPEPPVFKEPWIQRFSALFGEKKQTKEKKKSCDWHVLSYQCTRCYQYLASDTDDVCKIMTLFLAS